MSGINHGSKHMYSHHRYPGEYASDNGCADMLERLAQTRIVEDAKRETCQCREPVRLRKYMGQWACALCQRFMRGEA